MGIRISHTERDKAGEIVGRVYFDSDVSEYRAVIADDFGQGGRGYYTDSKVDALDTLRVMIKAQQS